MTKTELFESLHDAIDQITTLRERVASSAGDTEGVAISRGLDEVRGILVKFQEHCGRLDRDLDQREADIGRLRATAARAVLTEERSRHALADELQGELGQYLALAKYRLAELRGTTGSGVREAVAQIEALVDRAELSLRAVALQISPPSLYDLGLGPALECLAEEMERRFTLAVEVIDDDSPNVDDEHLRVLVFRCVRELLLNVARHAAVDRASVRLAADGETLGVRVVDKGCGFDVQVLETTSHGLFELREQLRHFNGNLVVTSSPSDGTTALVTVPLVLVPCAKHVGGRDGLARDGVVGDGVARDGVVHAGVVRES